MGEAVTRRDEVIRASELSQYAYCARAWWFSRVKGYRPANQAALRAGKQRHRGHGRAVQRYHLWRTMAGALVAAAGLSLVVWMLLNLVR
jgi:hypothetical protein